MKEKVLIVDDRTDCNCRNAGAMKELGFDRTLLLERGIENMWVKDLLGNKDL